MKALYYAGGEVKESKLTVTHTLQQPPEQFKLVSAESNDFDIDKMLQKASEGFLDQSDRYFIDYHSIYVCPIIGLVQGTLTEGGDVDTYALILHEFNTLTAICIGDKAVDQWSIVDFSKYTRLKSLSDKISFLGRFANLRYWLLHEIHVFDGYYDDDDKPLETYYRYDFEENGKREEQSYYDGAGSLDEMLEMERRLFYSGYLKKKLEAMKAQQEKIKAKKSQRSSGS